jgi:hypothetical protein
VTKQTISTVIIVFGTLLKWLLVTGSLSLASVAHAETTASNHYFFYDMIVEGDDI